MDSSIPASLHRRPHVLVEVVDSAAKIRRYSFEGQVAVDAVKVSSVGSSGRIKAGDGGSGGGDDQRRHAHASNDNER